MSALAQNPAAAPSIVEPRRLPIYTRWMVRRDLPEVCRIDGCSTPRNWGEEQFETTLTDSKRIGVVAETFDTQRVVGYMLYGLGTDSRAILRMCVDPAYRRRHIGSQLLGWLIHKIHNMQTSAHATRQAQHATRQAQHAAGRAQHVTAWVPDDQLPSHLFLQARGFSAIRVERGHIPESLDQDAYHFALRVGDER